MKPVINVILSRSVVRLAVVLLLGICLTSCATTSSHLINRSAAVTSNSFDRSMIEH